MPIPLLGSVAAVDQVPPDGAGRIQSVEARREDNAGAIGFVIVGIFGITILYLLHLGSLLFTKFNATTNQDFAAFVTGSLNPFLKECATTLGTVFGSTLGFVLGYYFKATQASENKSA